MEHIVIFESYSAVARILQIPVLLHVPGLIFQTIICLTNYLMTHIPQVTYPAC